MEYAIIFFISCCRNAEVAANMAVITPVMEHSSRKSVFVVSSLIRIRRNTPATTMVDLCSRADTGVGPSIAAGNQGCREN